MKIEPVRVGAARPAFHPACPQRPLAHRSAPPGTSPGLAFIEAPVYEAGIADLRRDETTILIHSVADNGKQFALVRVERPPGEAPPEDKK